MLFIQKEPLKSREVFESIIEITKTDEWKNADNNDTALLRSFFDRLDKNPIRDQLVREQHGLCAYCMKRIRPDNSMAIEHFAPVSDHKDKVLDYGNMLGCCRGGSEEKIKGQKEFCCGASKKEQPITIDPRKKSLMDMIRYRKDGRIYVGSKDAELNEKLQKDIEFILMLNGRLNKDGSLKSDTSTQIVMGRRLAYRGYKSFMDALSKKYKGNESRIKVAVRKKIDEIENMEQYPEYAGVTLYFLKRRIRG